MKRSWIAIWSLALLCALTSPLLAEEPQRFVQRQVHMGVEFTVILHASDQALAEKALAAAMERIAALDQALSDYLPESETNRLCAQAPTTRPIPVSADLFRVLQSSLLLSEHSGGAFDVTIGPLTKVWRRARRQKELPPAEDLTKARSAVGWKQVSLQEAERAVELKLPQMRLDFGGIAKGFAADEGLAAIRKLGITQALVQASGDIAVGDPPPGQPGWKVGLAPLNPDEAPTRFLWLKNQAVSTSGDARQHLVVKGRRYSHILDPRTGEPIAGRSSVSVIAPIGLIADGLATAIDVLGPTEGLKLLTHYQETAALVVVEEEGTQKLFVSRDWEQIAGRRRLLNLPQLDAPFPPRYNTWIAQVWANSSVATLECSMFFRVDSWLLVSAVALFSGMACVAQAGQPLSKGDRIVFLGDSITQAGAAPGGYVTLVKEALAKSHPDLSLEVIGAGISGNKVPDLEKRLEKDVLSRKPNVVVIYIGINDVWHSQSGKGTPKEEFDAGLRRVIQRINDAGSRVVVCTASVIGEKTDGSNPLDKMLDEYCEVSRKVAADTKSQLLDLRKAFLDHLKKANEQNMNQGILTSDTVHLNKAGNQFVAEQVLVALGAADEGKLLRHVVLFKFKEDVKPEAVQEIEKRFAALSKKIPTIVDFEWGTNNSPEGLSQGFTHCFLASFKSEKDRDDYLPHAAHKEFVEFLLPQLDKACVVDYWVKK